MRRHLFWPPSMIYISVIITHILHITNHAGPSVWAAIHVLHSGHFFSWDMGTPHDAILVFLWLWVSYFLVWQSSILPPCCWGIFLSILQSSGLLCLNCILPRVLALTSNLASLQDQLLLLCHLSWFLNLSSASDHPLFVFWLLLLELQKKTSKSLVF